MIRAALFAMVGLAVACATPPRPPPALRPELAALASAQGKYAGLEAVIEIPEDEARVGRFKDDGYWAGGKYRGRSNLPAGYWVYAAPSWYVWREVAKPEPAAAAPAPAVARSPHADNPHGPRPEAPPRVAPDDPLAPARRFLLERGMGAGAPREQLPSANGELAAIIALHGGGFLLSTARDERTAAEKDLRDRDGNRIYVAGRSTPLVIRLDAQGGLVWERGYKKKGFLDYAAGRVAEAKDGHFLALLPSYVHPGRWWVGRFLKLHRETGEVLWERQLRGDGGYNSPGVDSARLTERGTLALQGRIYLAEDVLRLWRGEIGGDGKLLSDAVGPFPPGEGRPIRFDHYADWETSQLNMSPELTTEAYHHVRRHRLFMAGRHWHIAARAGWMVPVAPMPGGGTVLIGVKDPRNQEEFNLRRPAVGPGTPLVVRLDAKGEVLWQTRLGREGEGPFGGGLVLPAADGGTWAMLPVYTADPWEWTFRFYRLSAAGQILWEQPLPPIAASGRTPELEKARLTDRGTLELRGFAYADRALRDVRVWDGELSADGKLLSNQVGGPRPRPGAMQIHVPDDVR